MERRPDGSVAAQLTSELALKPSTLSGHVDRLRRAGLVVSQRRGRSMRYFAAPGAIAGLHEFLVESCCDGEPAHCDARERRRARTSSGKASLVRDAEHSFG